MANIYFVHSKSDYDGLAYCANSRNQARALYAREYGEDYIYVQARKVMEAPEGMRIGEIDDPLWCLEHGVYSYVEDEECPYCHNYETIMYDPKYGFYCNRCEDSLKDPKRPVKKKVIDVLVSMDALADELYKIEDFPELKEIANKIMGIMVDIHEAAGIEEVVF